MAWNADRCHAEKERCRDRSNDWLSRQRLPALDQRRALLRPHVRSVSPWSAAFLLRHNPQQFVEQPLAAGERLAEAGLCFAKSASRFSARLGRTRGARTSPRTFFARMQGYRRRLIAYSLGNSAATTRSPPTASARSAESSVFGWPRAARSSTGGCYRSVSAAPARRCRTLIGRRLGSVLEQERFWARAGVTRSGRALGPSPSDRR